MSAPDTPVTAENARFADRLTETFQAYVRAEAEHDRLYRAYQALEVADPPVRRAALAAAQAMETHLQVIAEVRRG